MDTDEHRSENDSDTDSSVVLSDVGTSDHIALSFCERVADNLPAAGDVRLRVVVNYQGFAGEYNQVWIGGAEWRGFLSAMEQLEMQRQGCATLSALSPDKFELSISAVDAAGHLVADGFLGRPHFPRNRPTLWSRIAFSVESDPSRLRNLADRLRRLQSAQPPNR